MKTILKTLIILILSYSISLYVVCAEKNIASEAEIFVSSAPNFAWTPQKLVDKRFGAVEGWLGTIDKNSASPAPWLLFSFKHREKISAIVFYQANYKEISSKRFARPKNLKLEFENGKILKEIFLEDKEGQPQKFTYDNIYTDNIKIIATSVYSDAQIATLTGFQEIEILTDTGKKNEEEEIKTPKEKTSIFENFGNYDDETDKASKDQQTQENNTDADSLTAEERELINLLRELLEKLEKYIYNH